MTGWATAFVVAPGYLVTNAHAAHGTLRLFDPDTGRRYEGKLLALDEANDLALLRADTPGAPLPMGQDVTVDFRLRAFAIGFPDPSRYGTGRKLSPGWVRTPPGFKGVKAMTLYLTALGGSSGSPVFDAQGRIIGVVTGGLTTPLLRDGEASRTDPVPTATPLPELLAFLKRENVSYVTYGLAGALEHVAAAVAPSVYLIEQTSTNANP